MSRQIGIFFRETGQADYRNIGRGNCSYFDGLQKGWQKMYGVLKVLSEYSHILPYTCFICYILVSLRNAVERWGLEEA